MNMKTIDFHTHILPGADHGSDSTETSLNQIELSRKASVDTIIATPHFYPHRHRVEDFLKKREMCYNKLMSKTDADVILGAEVLLCEGLNRLKGIEALTISGTNVILLELPFTTFKSEYESSIEALIADGYKIVLAHADRYPRESIERLLHLGVKIQLNASSIARLIVKKHVMKWIDKGIVVGIGSDIHMVDKKAYKAFMKTKKKLGDKFLEIMKKSNEIIYVK